MRLRCNFDITGCGSVPTTTFSPSGVGIAQEFGILRWNDMHGHDRDEGIVIDWTAITAVVGSIFTLGGTLGGYTFAARNDEGRDRRADQRETRARRAALAERLEEERHNFQRDTFLELQDVLLDLTRWQALVNAQDVKTLKEHQALFQLPDELGGDDKRLLVATARKLFTRVLDPDLREAIGDFITICTHDSGDLKDWKPEDAIRELQRRDQRAATSYVRLAELLGEHLRAELDRRILVDEIDRPARDSV